MGSDETPIRRADVFEMTFPVAHPAGPAQTTYHERSGLLVRLEDAAGVTGWGETYAHPVVTAALKAGAQALIGATASSPRASQQVLTAVCRDPWAFSALSIALDDLRSRQLHVSVAALYGGAVRRQARAYASSGGYRLDLEIEQSWPGELERALSEGFTAAKFRIGRHDTQREAQMLRALRDHAGPQVALMVDANGTLPQDQAVQMSAVLRDLGYRWFEEPISRQRTNSSYPGYERLTARLDVAVAGGEGLACRADFDHFLRREAVDIIQPDVAICGGIGAALFVAEMADLRGVACVPHAWGGAVLLAATLALTSLLPDQCELPGARTHSALPLLEVDRLENPMRTSLAGQEPRPVDGYVAVPEGRGLGIEVDEDFVRSNATSRWTTHHPPLKSNSVSATLV